MVILFFWNILFINDFIIFCIEIYKNKHTLTGEEAFDIFNQYGVIEYLHNGYEMLHTQGDKWILNDIEEYLKIRNFS